MPVSLTRNLITGGAGFVGSHLLDRSVFVVHGRQSRRDFFKPLQLHLELANLMEQLSFLGMALVVGLRFISTREQLTGTLQSLPLPLAHLDRVNGVIGGDLLECLASTDRLHGDSGPKLRAMSAAFANGLKSSSQGCWPDSRLTVEPIQKNQINSKYTGEWHDDRLIKRYA
ncbi:MAG: hypothetical protein NTW02_07890 [Cyanobium sp. LacPavin_0920_WC12_MAG_62_9]|nr:hypothetical protein [Cyanobium sp. LacPavin_0920_WC12_MAG_62_9]